MESVVYQIVTLYCRKESYYLAVLELFHDVIKFHYLPNHLKLRPYLLKRVRWEHLSARRWICWRERISPIWINSPWRRTMPSLPTRRPIIRSICPSPLQCAWYYKEQSSLILILHVVLFCLRLGSKTNQFSNGPKKSSCLWVSFSRSRTITWTVSAILKWRAKSARTSKTANAPGSFPPFCRCALQTKGDSLKYKISRFKHFITIQRAYITQEHYGAKNVESVQLVKELYAELDVPKLYASYEETSYNQLSELIKRVDRQLPASVFHGFMEKIYKRSNWHPTSLSFIL